MNSIINYSFILMLTVLTFFMPALLTNTIITHTVWYVKLRIVTTDDPQRKWCYKSLLDKLVDVWWVDR